eukprot:2155381-Pleurochrysis_carterae.AAC.1
MCPFSPSAVEAYACSKSQACSNNALWELVACIALPNLTPTSELCSDGPQVEGRGRARGGGRRHTVPSESGE